MRRLWRSNLINRVTWRPPQILISPVINELSGCHVNLIMTHFCNILYCHQHRCKCVYGNHDLLKGALLCFVGYPFPVVFSIGFSEDYQEVYLPTHLKHLWDSALLTHNLPRCPPSSSSSLYFICPPAIHAPSLCSLPPPQLSALWGIDPGFHRSRHACQ